MAAPEVQLKNGDARVKIRNPVTCLILDIVTLGIYGLFWWYYTNRELADLGRARGTDELGDNPTNSVLALWFYQDQLNKVWEVEAEAPALEPGAEQPAQQPPPPPAAETRQQESAAP